MRPEMFIAAQMAYSVAVQAGEQSRIQKIMSSPPSL